MAWQILGHRRAVAALRHEAAAGPPTLAHAYLVSGPGHVGKRTVARELAAALNCDGPPEARPCHACRSCRAIDHESHPDVIVVERSEDRKDLKVEDVRAARGTVAYRAYQARYKVYLFVDADEMSRETFNVLLTDLEEPPPDVVFVVTASHPDALAPTVRSRCRLVSLQSPSARELATGLSERFGCAHEEAARLAALANGRVGWAVEAVANPALADRREAEIERVAMLSEPHPKGMLSRRLLLAAEACKGESFLESRAACLQTLDDMRTWWRDLLIVSTGSPAAIAYEHRRADLERQAASRGSERIARALVDIEQTAGAVERNATPRLALEALLLRMR